MVVLFSHLQLTSQHPYAEVYIGQPHVWTVDIDNSAEVERAIRSILSQKVNMRKDTVDDFFSLLIEMFVMKCVDI